MRHAGRVAAAAILLAAASALSLGAEKAPRRLVVAVEAKGGDTYTPEELLQLSRSLMSAVAASGAEILLLDWGPDPFPVDDPVGAADEVKRTADCWLAVTIGGSRKSPTLSVRSYDVLLQRETIRDKLQVEAAFDLPDPPAETWKPLVGMLASAYPPQDTDQPAKAAVSERPGIWTNDLAKLTLRAVPGTVVDGLDGEPRTVGEDGVFTEAVRAPATYLLRATHPDQLPLELPVYLEDDREVTLPQHRLARWSVDAGLYGMAFPQLEASYFLAPGWLYVRAGLMSYAGGLAFSDDRMFWSSMLSTLSARVGTYAFFPPESPFRPYVGAGALLRVAHDPAFFGVDPVAPVAVQLTLGFEVSPWPRSRFFLEWLPTEYLTRYPDLFAASMSWESGGMAFLPYAVIDVSGFRVGWRWML